MHIPSPLKTTALGLAFSSVAFAQSPTPAPPTPSAIRSATAPSPTAPQVSTVTESSRVRAFNEGPGGDVRSLYLQNGSVVDLAPGIGGQLGPAVRKGEKITVTGTKSEIYGQSLVEAARALRDIQKDHLYESAGHPTFEDYCEARWQFSRITGYSYANAYNTYETVKTVLTDTKLSFSHYAALSRLYDKHEETQKALKEFVEKHKDELKGITVRDLGKMVKAAEESEEGESGGHTMSEAARITARIKREAKKLPELIAEANPDADAKKKLAGALRELAKQYKAEADKLLGKYKEKGEKEGTEAAA